MKMSTEAKKELRKWVVMIALILVAFFTAIQFVTVYKVEGTSMEDTLHSGEWLMLEKLAYKGHEKRGDVVMAQMTEEQAQGLLLAKRIVALPGDTVEAVGGELLINGEAQDEPYAKGKTPDITKATLEEGYVFILGDNREASFDSEDFGPVPMDQIIGRLFFTIVPFGNKV
jgi:signal peptidase I